MKYKAKNSNDTVKVTKQDEHYVWFRKNGIELVVAKKRFYKVYEEIKNDKIHI